MKSLIPISLVAGGAFLASNAGAASVVLADPAADYVEAAGSGTTALTTLPDGWSYFVSDEALSGAETALTPGATGNEGEQGFASGGAFGTAAVLGTNTNGGQFELFGNGDGKYGCRWCRFAAPPE